MMKPSLRWRGGASHHTWVANTRGVRLSIVLAPSRGLIITVEKPREGLDAHESEWLFTQELGRETAGCLAHELRAAKIRAESAVGLLEAAAMP